MKKLNVNRDILTKGKVFALSLLLLGTAIIPTGCKKREVPKEEGTSQVFYLDQINTKDNSATFFNVGNFFVKGKSNLKDIQKANKKGVPAGVIINTVAENKAMIYKDAQYAKYILENSSIDYPVYLDVTNLLNNESLRMDEIITLISAFCSKLSSNNFFVGICGSSEDIKRLEENDKDGLLKAYISLPLDSSENTISTDIKNSIIDGNLNQISGFTNDDIYYVKEGDRLSDIAFAYELSVEDLLSYNNLKLDTDISEIEMLRIPTRNIPRVKTVNHTVENGSEPRIGLDMSYAQGNYKTDWDKLKENVSFIILRASYATVADEYFESFAEQCMQKNIPIGAYCFNECNPNDISNEDFKKLCENQTQKFIDTISGKHITLPAYLDQEKEYRYNEDQVVIMLDTWYEMLTNAGYTPGFYTTKSIYQEFKAKYDNRYGEGSLDKKFDRWIGGDFDYFNDAGFYWSKKTNTPMPYNSLVNLLSNKPLSPEDFSSSRWDLDGADIVQISEQGIGFGTGNGEGCVDVNITFKDYLNMAVEESVISEKEAKFLETMTPEQVSKVWYGFQTWYNCNPVEVGVLFGVTSAAACIALYTLFKNRQKLSKKFSMKVKTLRR